MKSEICSYVIVKKENFKTDTFDIYDENICPEMINKETEVKYVTEELSEMSGNKKSRVSCELCPSMEGIMRPTNKGGWCHIVCALYIPGAVFLSPEKFTNISVESVTNDIFNKVCSICVTNNNLAYSTIGACVKCKTVQCEMYFHVTCGLTHGFLGECDREFGGMQYLAYCPLHKHRAVSSSSGISSGNLISIKKRRRFTMPFINTDENRENFGRHESQLEKESEECSIVRESSVSMVDESSINDSNKNVSDKRLSHEEISMPNMSTCSGVEEGITENAKVECNSTNWSPVTSMDNVQPHDSSSPTPVVPPEIVVTTATVCPVDQSVMTNEDNTGNGINTSVVTSKRPSKRKAAVASTVAFHKQKKTEKTPSKSKEKSQMVKSTLKVAKVPKIKKPAKTDKTKSSTRVSKNKTVPKVPKSLFEHMNSICSVSPSPSNQNVVPATTSEPGASRKGCGFTGQTMEDLLEWQWHETGSLLMEQANTTDISSLLSSLHDLKHGNEQLLSKYLKLLRRRDHLRAINARLQMQLLSKPPESVNKPDTKNQNIGMRLDPQFSVAPNSVIHDTVRCPSQDPRIPTTNSNVAPSNMPPSDMTLTRVWSQAPSQTPVLPTFDQSLKKQARAVFNRCKQQYPGGNAPMSQTFMPGAPGPSQTELGAYFNHNVQMSTNNNRQSMMNPYQTNGLDLLYQALHHTPPLPTYQPPTLNVQDLFYQTASKNSAPVGNRWNYNSTIATSPDYSGK